MRKEPVKTRLQREIPMQVRLTMNPLICKCWARTIRNLHGTRAIKRQNQLNFKWRMSTLSLLHNWAETDIWYSTDPFIVRKHSRDMKARQFFFCVGNYNLYSKYCPCMGGRQILNYFVTRSSLHPEDALDNLIFTTLTSKSELVNACTLGQAKQFKRTWTRQFQRKSRKENELIVKCKSLAKLRSLLWTTTSRSCRTSMNPFQLARYGSVLKYDLILSTQCKLLHQLRRA